MEASSRIRRLVAFNVLSLLGVAIIEVILFSVLQNHARMAFNRRRMHQSDNFVSCSRIKDQNTTVPLKIEFMKYLDYHGNLRCLVSSSEDLELATDALTKWKLKVEEAKGGLYSEDFVFYEKSNKTGEMAVSAGKPTAHLLRYKGWRKRNNKRFKVLLRSGKHHDIRDWTHEYSSAFKYNGVGYHGGRLQVPYDGRYYVYSQTAFQKYHMAENVTHQANETNQGNDQGKARQHLLYRHSESAVPTYHQLIAKAYVPKFNTHMRTDIGSLESQTSYIGAVVELKKNDKIYVKVSNLHDVSNDPKSTYFGLHLI